ARLRPLQHDRAERARRDHRAGAGRLQLLEADVADPAARFLLLVGEQQAAARAAAVRVVAIAFRLAAVGAEAGQERGRLVGPAGIATEVARIVEGDGRTLG